MKFGSIPPSSKVSITGFFLDASYSSPSFLYVSARFSKISLMISGNIGEKRACCGENSQKDLLLWFARNIIYGFVTIRSPGLRLFVREPFSLFSIQFSKGIAIRIRCFIVFVRINLGEQEEGKRSEEIVFHSSCRITCRSLSSFFRE